MHSTAQDGLKLIACTIGRDARVGDERVLGASWRLGHAPGRGRTVLDAWAFLMNRDRRLFLALLLLDLRRWRLTCTQARNDEMSDARKD